MPVNEIEIIRHMADLKAFVDSMKGQIGKKRQNRQSSVGCVDHAQRAHV
jgi:hypothetical protein